MQNFLQSFQATTFIHCVLSCSVFFACDLMFFRPRAELEPSAAQTFESVDETFCQAEVPSLRRVLSTDRRNLHQQRYCSKPLCRKQSKAVSQRRWLQKPENENHFRGPENSKRVTEWRSRNPGVD